MNSAVVWKERITFKVDHWKCLSAENLLSIFRIISHKLTYLLTPYLVGLTGPKRYLHYVSIQIVHSEFSDAAFKC